jgi:hypothetical protein
MERTKLTIGLAALAVLAGTAAGCTSSTAASAASATTHPVPATTPTATQPNGSAAAPLAFGQTADFGYANVTVEAPTEYHPTESDVETFRDSGDPITEKIFQVRVTVTNHSNAALDTGEYYLTGIDDSGDADEWVGTVDDSLGAPTVPILPSRTISYTDAFQTTGSEFAVQVNVGTDSKYYQ